jgi:hypothetical protein
MVNPATATSAPDEPQVVSSADGSALAAGPAAGTVVAGVAGPREQARVTLDRAVGHLLGLQHEAGWWQGELETNVTMDAEDLLLREFLGIRTAEETQAAARWIRSARRDDGTWANFLDGRGLRGTAAGRRSGRRRTHDPDGRVDPGRRRDRGDQGLHQDLARPVRRVGLG